MIKTNSKKHPPRQLPEVKNSASKNLRSRFLHFFKINWPIPVLVIIVIVFFWKFFILGQIPIPGDFVIGTYYPWLDYKWGYEVGVPVKNPITTDVVSFTYPMRTLAVEMMKSGEWPLWNKNILTRTPLLANFQSAPFTLTNIFYFIFNKNIAWGLQVISQHVLAAFFMYLLLRNWKLSKAASIFGGLVYAFTGFNLIWSQWNAHTLVAAFIPLLLLSIEGLLIKGDWKYGLLFSLALVFQIFAGYPQLMLYSFIACFFYYFAIFRRQANFLRRTFLLSGFMVLGLGITSLQLIPAKELLSLSQRAVEPLEFSWAFLPWQKIITFVAPDFFGNHATANYWGPTDYTMTTGYIGVIALGLAFFSVIKLKSAVHIKYALALCAFSLILAFPTPISIAIWKSGFMGLQAASAHRALILFNFSVCILASIGLENIYGAKLKHLFWALSAPLLIIFPYGLYVILGLLNIPALDFVESTKLMVGLRNLIYPVLIYLLFSIILIAQNRKMMSAKTLFVFVILLTTLELFRFGWKFTPFTKSNLIFPMTPVLDFLKSQDIPNRVTSTDVIPINMKMPYGIESLEGYDAIYPVNIAQYIAVLNSHKTESIPQGRYSSVTNFTSPLFNIANAKYIVAVKKDSNGKPDENGELTSTYQTEGLSRAFEDQTTVILSNKNSLQRAVLYYEWEYVEEDDMLRRLLENDFDYKEKVLIDSNTQHPFKEDGKYKLKYQNYAYQESTISLNTDKPGYLFISDLYYPGWKAEIDGNQTEIEKANYAFMAIYLPAGSHVVRIYYSPESFNLGLKLSTLSFCILLLYTYKIKNVLKWER